MNRKSMAQVAKMIDARMRGYPTTGVVMVVDGNLADIRLTGRTTNIANCRIVGDPTEISVGMEVDIRWDDYHGTKRPVIMGGGASGTGLSASGLTTVITDNVTIEYSDDGLRVKAGGIGFTHLNFVPALEDHDHDISEWLKGWDVTDDGILWSGDISLNPAGEITLGRDPDIVKLSTQNGDYRIWAGALDPASAPFSVSKTGHLISSSATIAGWDITATEIKKTGIVLDSANDQILVGASAPNIVIDGGNKIIKSSNFQPGFAGFGLYANSGNAEFLNVVVRGTIRASVFNIGELTATAGSYGVFKSAAELYSDVTTPSSVGTDFDIEAKNNETGDAYLLAVGDLLRIKAWNGTALIDVWCSVNAKTPYTGYSEYDVKLQSGTSIDLNKGMAIIAYGLSTDGHIIMSADDTFGTSANISIAEMVYGIVSSFSIANAGQDYTAGDSCFLTGGGSNGECYCQIDTVDGGGAVTSISLYSDWKGYNYTRDQTYVTQYGSHTGTGLTVTVDTIEGPWSGYLNSQILKVRIGNMSGSYGLGEVDQYGFGVGGYADGNYMSYNAGAGEGVFKISAGGGSLAIDADGITLDAKTIWADPTAISWQDTSYNEFFYLRGRTNDFGPILYYTGELALEPPSGLEAFMEIRAKGAAAGDEARIVLTADDYNASVKAHIDIHNTDTGASITIEASDYINLIADITLIDDTRIDGGLSVGTGSTVTTSGRVKISENLYTGGGIVLGYTGGSANADMMRFYSGTILVGEIGTQDSTWLRLNQNVAKDIYTPRTITMAGGLYVGGSTLPGTGNIGYSGYLRSYKNSTSYAAYAYVPLTVPINGTSWWATAKSTGGTYITVTTTFPGLPANTVALHVRLMARDSAGGPRTSEYLTVGPDSTNNNHIGVHCQGDNVIAQNNGIVKVTSGTIYAYCVASGSLTMDCWLAVVGYFI